MKSFIESKEYKDVVDAFVKKYNIEVDGLTEAQTAKVIREAISSGDFVRYVSHDRASQQVVYIPFAEAERVRGLYDELIYAVARVFDGETRHETALRYIRDCESLNTDPPNASSILE